MGMLERIVDWNGHGRTIIGLQCGLDAQDGSSIDLSSAAGLMAVANAWRIRPRLFASTRQTFEPEDIDRCGGLGATCLWLCFCPPRPPRALPVASKERERDVSSD